MSSRLMDMKFMQRGDGSRVSPASKTSGIVDESKHRKPNTGPGARSQNGDVSAESNKSTGNGANPNRSEFVELQAREAGDTDWELYAVAHGDSQDTRKPQGFTVGTSEIIDRTQFNDTAIGRRQFSLSGTSSHPSPAPPPKPE